jgi:SPP1 gp7 family putative phage head morphogenesis protein
MKKNYWIQRQNQRLVASELKGKVAIAQMNEIYRQALLNINGSLNKLYSRYATEVGLDVSELSTILNAQEQSEYIQAIQRSLQRAGITTKGIFDDRMLARITRLQALKKQVYFEILSLQKMERDISLKTYQEILNNTYNSTQDDLRLLEGIKGTFSTLDTKIANRLLLERWEGGNYASRILKSTSKLNMRIEQVLQKELPGVFTSGIGLEKVNSLIKRNFQISAYESARLVRTETNYFHNQAELQAYVDDGIEEYEYLAVLDGRTSTDCRNLDGERIPVQEAKVGDNYPPLHPNCRSVTIPVVNFSK